MPRPATQHPEIVLVTGVSRFLGSSLAGRLSALPYVARVIGVDVPLPDVTARARFGDAEFMRTDIRYSTMGELLRHAKITTVVHASTSTAPVAAAARSMTKEMNVLGTMQLLAACQRSETVRAVVVRSTSAVFGGSSKDPSVFTETTVPRGKPAVDSARDAADIEGYVRGFARRRPDVRVAMPRFAEIVGPTVRTPLTRYFSLGPAIPAPWGRDPLLQFVHETDAIDVLEQLAMGDPSGAVNVAGRGTLTLNQAIRLVGRWPLPVPMKAMDTVSTGLRLARIRGFSTQQLRLLTSNRVLDTSRLTNELGMTLRYSTRETFESFARAGRAQAR